MPKPCVYEPLGPVRRVARLRGWSCLLLAGLSSSAQAEQPTLHEFIELGANRESITLRPVAAQTLDDPALDQASAPNAPASGPTVPLQNVDPISLSSLEIDRDTTRPESTDYEDPFTPTIAPFKRAVVFDSVDRLGRLQVADSTLKPIGRERSPRLADEHFHASISVTLDSNRAVALPSVAPGSRWSIATMTPTAPFELLQDSAENWFVRSSARGPHKLTLQLIADRGVFGSDFGSTRKGRLRLAAPGVPAEVTAAAREVAEALGLGSNPEPRQVVHTLVRHFRRFRESAQVPLGDGLQLFRELALGGRGICRHRAYSFTVTALGLGIPTRYAMNEAHAWVEVFDGAMWHRIDLGGAAGELAVGGDSSRPAHVEPTDPFEWPERSGSAPPPGHSPAPREQLPPVASPQMEEGTPNESESGIANTGPQPPSSQPFSSALESHETGSSTQKPISAVSLTLTSSSARRGQRLSVRGHVLGSGGTCKGAEVGIVLLTEEGQEVAELGTLLSNRRGKFEGNLTIPWQALVGNYTVTGRLNSECKPDAL